MVSGVVSVPARVGAEGLFSRKPAEYDFLVSKHATCTVLASRLQRDQRKKGRTHTAEGIRLSKLLNGYHNEAQAAFSYGVRVGAKWSAYEGYTPAEMALTLNEDCAKLLCGDLALNHPINFYQEGHEDPEAHTEYTCK